MEDGEVRHVQTGVLSFDLFYQFAFGSGREVTVFVNREGERLEEGEDDEEEVAWSWSYKLKKWRPVPCLVWL